MAVSLPCTACQLRAYQAIYQPPYSPQLNPAEHIWEELREKYLPNRLFSSLDQLIEELCTGLNALSADQKGLQSMTWFPHFRIEV